MKKKINVAKKYLALEEHLANRQAILFPLAERAKKVSKHSLSLSVYCQSAFSVKFNANFVLLVSSGFNSYEASGGRKAEKFFFCKIIEN